MRYFLIHCMYSKNGVETIINSATQSEKFINAKKVTRELAEVLKADEQRIIITGIFEFKNQEDYLNFTK